MTVTKNIEKLENSAARLSINVGVDDVRAVYAGIVKDFAKNARIDGFRKGKVPSSVLERKYGPQLKAEAMGKLLEEAVEKALEGETLLPLSYAQPVLDGDPVFELDQDFGFSITYDVFPEVQPCDISTAEVEVPQCVITQVDEGRELELIRERNALVIDCADDSTAIKGNIATVDYAELDDSGEAVTGTERQDFVFEIGTGHNLYKFDDEILGMKKGDVKVIEKTFASDYEYSELAGLTKRLTVKLTKLKEKKLPDLDDELAQDVSEKFETLADLKADIRARLEKRLEERLKSIKEKSVVDALLAGTTVVLPVSMVEAELRMRKRNLMQRMNLDSEEKLNQLFGENGRSIESLYDDWRPDAERSIRTRLILDKLIADGAYEVSEDDIAAELVRHADEAGMSVEDLKAEYERRGMMDYLKDRIKEDRLMVDLLGKMTIKPGKSLAFVDLFKENE